MRVGQRHAQRRCACHTCRRARAGANGGGVGVPFARRVGGARRQPFHPRAKLTVQVKKRVAQHQKRFKGFVCLLSVNEILNPKKVSSVPGSELFKVVEAAEISLET